MGKFIDMTGERYGRLTVIKRIENKKRGDSTWLCKCDCDENSFTEVAGYSLRKGFTKSCGCIKKEVISIGANKKHGLRNSKLYGIWNNMKNRCSNQNVVQYKNYGGRGITVCDEWLNSFEEFSNWSFDNGYKEGLSLDRIDVNGNYEPQNCRWVTMKVQQNNRRNNRYITIDGITMTVSNWEKEYGLYKGEMSRKLNLGQDAKSIIYKKKIVAMEDVRNEVFN